MRKLASIQRINAVEPIEGADAIERVRVLGWYVVVKKGEFSVGDHVVYCEIDSVLPDRPEFEFLRPRGFRIRTIKLKGQVSQGITFPLSVLPDDERSGYGDFRENDDVTEMLGVIKYEPAVPACLAGKVKGGFPGDIPKTDEERVQNIEPVLGRKAGTECYAAEKLDGSSTTIYLRNGEFGVCSRNLDLYETEGNSFWQTVRKLKVEEKLRAYSEARGGKSFSLQAELVGPAVQNNKLKLKELTFYFFNILDISEGRFLDLDEMLEALKEMGLQPVPVVERFKLNHTIDQLVEMATRKSVLCPTTEAEGIVIRPVKEDTDPLLGRFSFKAINPKFLLKHEDA